MDDKWKDKNENTPIFSGDQNDDAGFEGDDEAGAGTYENVDITRTAIAREGTPAEESRKTNSAPARPACMDPAPPMAN